MQPYEYSVSFRIFHPSANPADFTRVLKMEPRRAWRAGEPRTTPKGTPLRGSYRESYWYTDLCRVTDASEEPLEDALHRFVSQLGAHREFLLGLRNDGGRAEFYIGLNGPASYGLELEPQLLTKVASIGLTLALEVFPVPQSR